MFIIFQVLLLQMVTATMIAITRRVKIGPRSFWRVLHKCLIWLLNKAALCMTVHLDYIMMCKLECIMIRYPYVCLSVSLVYVCMHVHVCECMLAYYANKLITNANSCRSPCKQLLMQQVSSKKMICMGAINGWHFSQ